LNHARRAVLGAALALGATALGGCPKHDEAVPPPAPSPTAPAGPPIWKRLPPSS